MLTFLSLANCFINFAVISGDSSYSPNILGNPALGYTDINRDWVSDNSSIKGIISLHPKEQFNPIEIIFSFLSDSAKASKFWPERVLPDLSVNVPEIIIGRVSCLLL